VSSFSSLLDGFAALMTWQVLALALLGCAIGTAVGVLPGIGPVAGIAILLPLTYTLPPVEAIVTLAAIYYGAMFGGSITSILLNVPGEAASVITCLDGYPMAQQGRGGIALSMSAIGSFIGGTIAAVGLILVAPPISALALGFGPPELFAFTALALALVLVVSSGALIKGVASLLLGMVLAVPGLDPMSGAPRLTFDQVELLSGLAFIPILMGVFGLGEVLVNAERVGGVPVITKLMSIIPRRRDLVESVGPIARGTAIGFALGPIPGMGATTSTVLSYAVEKKVSKTPELFGKGALPGVVGPETTNNAFANGALVPLFALGIPGSPTVAILVGGFLLQGITPGPQLFTEHPDVIWPVIASLLLGNVILLVLNLPLVGMWAKLVSVPYKILAPVIVACTIVGAYTINGTVFDVGVLIVFGFLGYAMRKGGFPLAPFAMGLILGPIAERNFRAAISMSGGDYSILFRSWLSTAMLVGCGLVLVLSLVGVVRGHAEDEGA
jgi:putative tricarboxylic transport membrane protein